MNPSVILYGTKEYKKLEAVAKMLEALSPNNVEYEVDDTYFDFGQGWKWTTILAYDSKGVIRRYQAINPREWGNILLAENEKDLAEIVTNIRNGKFFNDK